MDETGIPDLDLQELQLADQYNNALPAAEDDVPTVEFEREEDDDVVITETPAESSAMSCPTSRRPLGAFIGPDSSEPIPHERVEELHPNKFKMAVGLYCIQNAVSRTQYDSLLEIFKMLGPHKDISRLPESLSTLKRHTMGQLPLLQQRKASIRLIPEKLPTLSADKKGKKRKKENPENSAPREDLIFFDPEHLFKAFLSSDEFRAKMHIGMAEFVDSPTEMWHSHSWAASVRTTSGQFAHYPGGETLLPSDFINYKCGQNGCKCGRTEYVHIGRIYEVGIDKRGKEPTNAITLKIQEVLRHDELDKYGITVDTLTPHVRNHELLFVNNFFFLPEDSVVSRIQVMLDYAFKDNKGQGERQIGKQLFIRWIITPGSSGASFDIRPLCLSHPHRAELELREFTRQSIVNNFDCKNNGQVPCYSVPLLTFIDGFGLYRNSYRSIMGIYLIMASLTFRERNRRSNVLQLTLGPHGNNFEDMIEALQCLYPLDSGVYTEIKGQKCFVCIFTLCYLGDMPQQQENAGFKTQRANLGCRFCFITADERHNLDYDVIKNGRYHNQTSQLRRNWIAKATKREQDAYATEWGLGDSLPLAKISPALDLILTRPIDPAHSEYNGLSRRMHALLVEAILSPVGAKIYAAYLRLFPFPQTWPRLQSPTHHLKSYSLSDHGRWSCIIPGLLRCWLRGKYIQPHFLQRLQLNGRDPLQTIVAAYGAMARSNTLLMSDSIATSDRANFEAIVKEGRKQYQLLLQITVEAFNANPRSRSTSIGSLATHSQSLYQSRATISSNAMGGSRPAARLTTEEKEQRSKKAVEYANEQNRPNFHTALHLKAMMEEYGMPSNCNVLIGEEKHRESKKHVYSTNHSNVERQLLRRQNFQQTIRLILLKSFETSDPGLTALMLDIYQDAPTLFESLLPKSELATRGEDGDEDNLDVMKIEEDPDHKNPKTIGRLKPAYVTDFLDLPTRSSNTALPPVFLRMLQGAYTDDHGMPGIFHFGTRAIQWAQKVSFYDRSVLLNPYSSSDYSPPFIKSFR